MGRITSTAELWYEKYRPRTLDDMILPMRIRKLFINGLQGNYIFSGKPGTGKTTLAKILMYQTVHKFINASKDNGIGVIRTTIDRFATGASLRSNAAKTVVLDEFERMSPDSQSALKGVIEEFASTARFLFTTNYPERITETALFSRMKLIDFNFAGEEFKECLSQSVTYISNVLTKEGFTIERSALIYLVKEVYPDMRQILNELQNICASLEDSGETEVRLDHVNKIKKVTFEDLFAFIASCPDDIEIYQFMNAKYKGRFMDVLDSYGQDFLDYLIEKDKAMYIGFIAKLVHKYSFEAIHIPNKLIPVLAISHEIVTALKRTK